MILHPFTTEYPDFSAFAVDKNNYWNTNKDKEEVSNSNTKITSFKFFERQIKGTLTTLLEKDASMT